MANVIIGSARINENGGINGGAAGDQTGREVATEPWYLHSKGWVVIRAKEAAIRELIATCMEMACANNNMGYCQDHRLTGFNEAEKHNFDVSKITVKVEIDCSELVRICVYYAGIKVADFNTASELATLKATGMFDILTDDKYCNQQDYLLRGDILVTKTKGHTVVVLSNGSRAGSGESATGTSGTNYKVGAMVSYTGTKHYTSANATTPKTCKPGPARITAISEGTKHPYHVVHTDSTSNVYGWVDAKDIGDAVSSSGSAAGSTSSAKTHKVVKGDTLSAIARKYGTTVAKIVDENKSKYPKITASYIVVGWILTIPQ